MPKKIELPNKAPRFSEGEWVTAIVTVISGTISALLLAYHVYADIEVDVEFVKWSLVILSGAFAFGMSLVPMSLARAHGTALEGSNAQSGLLLLVGLFAAVDAALQVHAIMYGASLIGYTIESWVLPAVFAGAFQVAAFFVRGQLIAASQGIQELIDARNKDIQIAAEYAKQKELAKRRERYAENKVVNIR